MLHDLILIIIELVDVRCANVTFQFRQCRKYILSLTYVNSLANRTFTGDVTADIPQSPSFVDQVVAAEMHFQKSCV